VTPVDPIGPVEVRPRPVERALAVERSRRPGRRDPQRDARERDRGRERPRDDEKPDGDGHIDVRA
jgi:hypothetical protein